MEAKVAAMARIRCALKESMVEALLFYYRSGLSGPGAVLVRQEEVSAGIILSVTFLHSLTILHRGSSSVTL